MTTEMVSGIGSGDFPSLLITATKGERIKEDIRDMEMISFEMVEQ